MEKTQHYFDEDPILGQNGYLDGGYSYLALSPSSFSETENLRHGAENHHTMVVDPRPCLQKLQLSELQVHEGTLFQYLLPELLEQVTLRVSPTATTWIEVGVNEPLHSILSQH